MPRLLAAAHVLIGLILLLLAPFFGLVLLPVLALGPLWLVWLGIKLWRDGEDAFPAPATTHKAGLAFALLLCAYGLWALQMAAASAEAGGGIMGGFGFLPLSAGLLLGSLSAASWLWAARRR